MSRIINSLSEISDRYDAVFCDLWGCLHNGYEPFETAVEALRAFRKKGGKVVLLTNAPRPRAQIETQITKIGVPRDCWDVIATSGDSARAAMFEGVVGHKVYFIGEAHDQVFFDPIHIVENAIEIERVPLADAEGIVCCGPFDARADPDVMRPDFQVARDKGIKLLCANPDIVVDRGDSREWCAGALARLYEQMGGESLYFGKPHLPVYDLARRRLAALGDDIPDDRILAIGDGIGTDVKGALGQDIDVLFVTGGLAAEETGTRGQPDPDALDRFLKRENMSPGYSIGYLR